MHEFNYSLSSYEQIVEQNGHFNLGMAIGLKTDLVSHPARAEGLVNIYNIQ